MQNEFDLTDGEPDPDPVYLAALTDAICQMATIADKASCPDVRLLGLTAMRSLIAEMTPIYQVSGSGQVFDIRRRT